MRSQTRVQPGSLTRALLLLIEESLATTQPDLQAEAEEPEFELVDRHNMQLCPPHAIH